jgi:hypothetical protein
MEPGAPGTPSERLDDPAERHAERRAEQHAPRPPLARTGKLAAYDEGLPGWRRRRALTAIAATGAITGASLFLGVVSAGLLPGLLTAGAGAAIYLHRRRQHRRVARIMDRLSAFRPVRNRELAGLAEGTPVRVRGRVGVHVTVPGVLDPGRQGAWRALFIHEAVVRQRLLFVEHGWDFDVRDDSGVTARVQVAHARLLLALIEDMPWTLDFTPVRPEQLERLARVVPDEVRGKRAFDPAHLRCWEYVLAQDAEVDVLGFATTVIGPGASALPREAPRQPALAGRREHPLIVVPREA